MSRIDIKLLVSYYKTPRMGPESNPSSSHSHQLSKLSIMYVVKRDGRHEQVKFDKITSRIQKLCYGLNEEFVDPAVITQKVIQGVYPGITTVQLDNLAAETSACLITSHPDYSVLAARICASNLHKETEENCFRLISDLYHYVHPKTGEPAPLIKRDVYEVFREHQGRIQEAINMDADYEYDYFGFKTLEKSYLLRMDGKIAERPQHMLMRVAVGVHGSDIDKALEMYAMMSSKKFTMATPTLFNSGCPNGQMSSCYLMTMKEDSIDGIYDTLKNCAIVSKYAGGIGLSCHDVRASNSYIRGTNGISNGLVPMLRVFNNTARYVDQGGGKRKGSIAIYLEPHHADIESFLDLRKNHGNDMQRARDLFYALWVSDLFMRRVETNSPWSLFCPNEAPGLSEVCGQDFVELYEKYESQGKARKVMKARDLWNQIVDVQVETGTPYMLYKDAANAKSNQKHLGVIKSSNLCTEIMEYTSKDEIAVCNLASINLSILVKNPYGPDATFDLEELERVAYQVTGNLDKVIERNFYPVQEAKNSNMRHRPIGIGVQGLADAFVKMRFAFDSPEAAALNRDIFETMYFGAMTASADMAKTRGCYPSFKGSPASQGLFQFDLWGVKPSDRHDWAGLKERVMDTGLRNSLLTTLMPTASTSQILGNNESLEAYVSNVYTRRVLSGEFVVINKHLLHDLTTRGLWTDEVKQQLFRDQGSVQGIKEIPDDLKKLYKVVWEIPQRVLIDQSAARGPYICQSQSLNIHMDNPNRSKLTSMHFYGWKKGLKTGSYYLRTKPKSDAMQFAIDRLEKNNSSSRNTSDESADGKGSETDADSDCLSCGA